VFDGPQPGSVQNGIEAALQTLGVLRPTWRPALRLSLPAMPAPERGAPTALSAPIGARKTRGHGWMAGCEAWRSG